MTSQDLVPILYDAWIPYLPHKHALERARNVATGLSVVSSEEEAQIYLSWSIAILNLPQYAYDVPMTTVAEIAAAGIVALRRARVRLPLSLD